MPLKALSGPPGPTERLERARGIPNGSRRASGLDRLRGGVETGRFLSMDAASVVSTGTGASHSASDVVWSHERG